MNRAVIDEFLDRIETGLPTERRNLTEADPPTLATITLAAETPGRRWWWTPLRAVTAICAAAVVGATVARALDGWGTHPTVTVVGTFAVAGVVLWSWWRYDEAMEDKYASPLTPASLTVVALISTAVEWSEAIHDRGWCARGVPARVQLVLDGMAVVVDGHGIVIPLGHDSPDTTARNPLADVDVSTIDWDRLLDEPWDTK